MLSLIVIALVAGMCYTQSPSEYSDCSKLNEITTVTCENHLSYLKTQNSNSYNYFLEISQLKNPIALVHTVIIEKACNQSPHLKMFYTCVFEELQKCLVNSSQGNMLPVPKRMADAIVTLCENQKEINSTCYQEQQLELEKCTSEEINQRAKAGMDMSVPAPKGDEDAEDEEDHVQMSEEEHKTYHIQIKQTEMVCNLFEGALSCLQEKMNVCQGFEPILENYFIATKPMVCPDTSAACPSGLISAYLLLLAAFFSRLL